MLLLVLGEKSKVLLCKETFLVKSRNDKMKEIQKKKKQHQKRNTKVSENLFGFASYDLYDTQELDFF